MEEISKRHETTAALRESEESFRTLAANLPGLVYRVHLREKGRMQFFNDMLLTMTGYTAEELTAGELCSIEPYIAAADRPGIIAKVKAALQENRPFQIEYRFQRKDGSYRQFHERGRPVREHGKPLYIDGIILDITEHKRAEEELREREVELQAKNAELESFTYTISHDLKSPLVTVKTFLGHLEKDLAEANTEYIAQDIKYMRAAADKMGRLLEELLEMSRIGRVVNPAVHITLGDLVNEALSAVAGRIAEKGVEVQVTDADVQLYGDRLRLAAIWQNLLENAVKFMGDQPSPHIEIGAKRRDKDTVFYVRDNGMGIDPRHAVKVFNLFEKLDPKSDDGTGIGLSLVKRIVELYKGTIWLESDGVGRGSCFQFTLPRAIIT